MIIQPKLSFDFTAASLSPLIALTRVGATATRVNSSGNIEIVAADVARFDYDPVTLAPRGLLIEEQRVNLLTYSEQFDNAAWVTVTVTVAVNTAVSPSGATTAATITADGSSDRHFLGRDTATFNLPTLSVFLKKGTNNFAQLRFFNDTVRYANFDLDNGTASGFGDGNNATITAVANGWYRCSITSTTSITGFAVQVVTGLSAVRNETNTLSTSIFIWGAQLEAGAFATSYIPTEATVVTRNADVATITGTNFSDFWQAGKGGVLIRALPSTVSGIRPLVQFDDNTADNIIALRGNTTNPELYIKATTDQAQLDAGTIAANTGYSLTGWWATNDCKARQDSGAVVTDTTATIPTVTQMRIGSDGTNYLNGTIATIDYYDSFFGRPIYTRRKNKVFASLL